MSLEIEVTPDNPKCPCCGAADWLGDARFDWGLLLVDSSTGKSFQANKEMMIPVQGFVCGSCRFLRLRVAEGNLVRLYPPEER